MVSNSLKNCSVCKLDKPTSEFYRQVSSKDGLYPRCKTCDYEAQKCYIKANREDYLLKRRENYLKSKYDLGVEEYTLLLANQNGVCAICERSEKDLKSLAVDHDHNSGEVRGILCNKCNRAIGLFNDDPKLLKRAAEYIQTH